MNEPRIQADQLRGWTARALVAQDACWVADIAYSSKAAGKNQAYSGLLLGQHFARIAYEGTVTIRSKNPQVGQPLLADLLSEQYAAVTARTRHVSKILDDTKRSYESVLDDFHDAYGRSHKAFTGKAARPFRWLERDLGVYSIDGQLVGASIPMAYRLALDPADPRSMSGENLTAVTSEWGGTIAVLMAAADQQPLEAGTMDLSAYRVKSHDLLAAKYLAGRYEPDFPVALKLLLMMIEGDLNTNRTFLPLTGVGHEMAVFRAQVVTLYHALTSLKRIVDRYAGLDSRNMKAIREVLEGGSAVRLLAPEGKRVRDRCVHYEIRDPSLALDWSLPMFGIVEAVYPGATWESFNRDGVDTANRLADLLGNW